MTAILASLSSRLGSPIIFLVLCVVIPMALGFFATSALMRWHRGQVDAAAVEATEKADMNWKLALERANLENEREARAALEAALVAQAEAEQQIRAAERRQTELEKDNASLPDADACGLDHDRVRLLRR